MDEDKTKSTQICVVLVSIDNIDQFHKLSLITFVETSNIYGFPSGMPGSNQKRKTPALHKQNVDACKLPEMFARCPICGQNSSLTIKTSGCSYWF